MQKIIHLKAKQKNKEIQIGKFNIYCLLCGSNENFCSSDERRIVCSCGAVIPLSALDNIIKETDIRVLSNKC